MKSSNIRKVALLTLPLSLFACKEMHQSEEAKAAAEIEEAKIPLNAWAEAMASRKTENVLAMYDEDAVLIATFEKKPITNQEDRKKYFDGLLKKENLKVTYNEIHADIEDDVLTANGLYTFSFTEAGKVVEAPARFTFVFEKDDGVYQIESHHSSLVPQQ